ncbi:eukaryotic translation initiation factor 4 gamma 3-like [Calliphora vicina]|uniref:eukaryotic translation initiation factor 4 gamma 3-like n=1 Tax=Calliphora vicina TaxID=7373 RepID=UPI00325AABED
MMRGTTNKLSSNRQQVSDVEKLSLSQGQQTFSGQHILYTPVLYISGNGSYVAAPSAGYTLPQQSGLQQPTLSAAVSASAVSSQPPLQLLHGIQPSVSSGQQTDLYKMQPQSGQNIYVPQSTANNSTGRSNQPANGNIYRQNPSSPSPRNTYVHSTIYPAVQQNFVLGHFTAPYATRTPQLQQCQYSPQNYPQMYFPYYLQQPPQQQRTAVKPGVGVGLSSAMTVQPRGSVSGPTAPGNQAQLPLGVAPTSTVLSFASKTAAKPVRVAPLVGMPHQPPPQQQLQNPIQTKGKLRSHALQIIHPVTNRNILEESDIAKNESTNIASGCQSSSSSTNAVPSLDIEIESLSTASTLSIKSELNIPETLKSHTEVVQPIEEFVDRNFKETTQQQQKTAIVSPLTDVPSVEILTTQPQKQKTKKSQNIADMKLDQNLCQGNCVQDSLPTNYINQEVQEQLKDQKLEENISSKSPSSSLKTSSDNNTISKQKQSKESCTEEYFEQEKSSICNIADSVKTMPLGIQEFAILPQQKQINIVNSSSNVQHKEEQEQRESQYTNATNGNSLTTTTAATLNESTDNTNNLSTNTTNKNADKLDNKNDNITEKTEVASATIETVTGCADTCKTITLEDEDRDETDKPNFDSENKQNVENSSTKSSTTPTNNNATTISTKNEKTKTEPSNDNNNESKEGSDDKKEGVGEDNNNTDETAANNKPSLINYNEGQWSPSNPSGKKQYNRDQMMQLREVKASRIQPEVKNTSIFSQTNLMPAFASRGNKKVQSMVGGFGGARHCRSFDANYQNNYMKQSSMSGRGGADVGHHNRNSGKPIIHLNLSLNQDVKLNEADNAWRPSVLVKCAEKQIDPELKAQREKDELIRRVRGILNKLTPEKFEPLVEEIIKLKIDNMEKMEAVMILVFEKAIDEPNFSVSYASLCHRLINEVKARDEHMESGTKSNLAYFRNALLDKTEREFNQNVTKSSAKEEKLKPIREKINNPTDPKEKVELEALLDEEERKIRRRSGGTVRFIGELFKISILTGKIIHTCIEALLKDPNNEDMLECLCKLLTTVGQKFEQTHISKDDERKYSLESVIQRMQNIALKHENSKISSRIRFMLQDVIDLRKKKWQSTRNEAPKTMEQIEKEANNEKLSNPYHYMNSMPGGSAKHDGGGRNDSRSGNYEGTHSQQGATGSLKRRQGGGGVSGGSHSQSGNSNNDDTWHVQTGKGNRTQAVDSSKLVGLTTVDMNNKKMGGLSLFLWPKTSSQPTTIPSNSFAANKSSDRDPSGKRNKGSYNKGSMKRDRHGHGRLLSRTGSTQASRENSSSRSSQKVCGMGGGNSSNMQKSASHSKYQQPMLSSTSLSRMTSSKMSGMSTGRGGSGHTASSSLYRDNQQQQSSHYSSNVTDHQQQHFKPAASESTQPSSAPPAVFEEPSYADLKIIKAVVIEMGENAANSKCIDNTTVSCIKKIKENQRCGLVYYIITDYLHLANVGPMCRRHLANVVAFLIENKYISAEHFRLAYKHFSEFACDLIVDIPELWLYIFEFTGPLIVKKLITANDLWNTQLSESGSPNFCLKFLKTFLKYCTREVGPRFTRNMWNKNHIKWTDFMNENEVNNFIQTNKFEYVENEEYQPDIDNKESKEKRNKRVVKHIDQLLKEGSNADNLIDYINGNIVDVDKTFIKSLTTTLTSFAIKDSNNYSLDLPCFQKMCIPVLLRYLDNKEDLELECLYAIQLLVHNLEHPRGLLGAIFGELNDADVIPQETFIAWRDSKDQSTGKGVAVKALNSFFNQVINCELCCATIRRQTKKLKK